MSYATIVIDPPWTMPTGGPHNANGWPSHLRPSRLPYETMSVAEIAALPVDEWASKDAHLYLWTTNARLEEGYEIARAWRFRPSQLLTWCKPPRGLGMGGAFTSTTEFVIFARRGSLPPLQREDSSWWRWSRGEHSAKPEAFLDMVERVSPAPRLEIFARRNRLGWDTWGNESLEHVTPAVLASQQRERAAVDGPPGLPLQTDGYRPA